MEKTFKIRCSSLHAIMADPQSYPRDEMSDAELSALKTVAAKRTAEQVALLDSVMDRTLSEGAKTHVHGLVRQHVYDYPPPELGTKEIRKGNMMEQSALNLLSIVTGDMLTKNETTFANEYLTGTPDTWCAPRLYDTKVPFTIESFPIVSSIAERMAKQAGYEWQGRGYLLLANEQGIPLERFAISYCLMETPSDLMNPWDDEELHSLPMYQSPERRVTNAWFERDLKIEEKIKVKCKAAQKYAQELIEKFYKEHGE